MEKHGDVELCFDVMYINNIGLLTAIGKMIRFCSLVPINSKKHEDYFKALDVIT